MRTVGSTAGRTVGFGLALLFMTASVAFADEATGLARQIETKQRRMGEISEVRDFLADLVERGTDPGMCLFAGGVIKGVVVPVQQEWMIKQVTMVYVGRALETGRPLDQQALAETLRDLRDRSNAALFALREKLLNLNNELKWMETDTLALQQRLSALQAGTATSETVARPVTLKGTWETTNHWIAGKPVRYHIDQPNENEFGWAVLSVALPPEQTRNGKIEGNRISIEYSVTGGGHDTDGYWSFVSGEIVESQKGAASRIRWSNGVEWKRVGTD